MNRKQSRYFDYSLLFIVIFLVCFGLLMLYSVSSYNAQIHHEGDGAYFLRRQLFATGLGLAVMAFFAVVDYRFWKKFWWVFYAVALLSNIAVHFFGHEVNGSRRWFRIGPLSIQPSEFAKLGMIIFLAVIIDRIPRQMGKLRTILKIMVFVLPVVAAIAIENLSTAIIVLGISIFLVFVASPKYLQFILIGFSAVGVGAVFLATAAYRLERIRIWRNPENYEKGYQTLQALYAIGSGGLFGKGLGGSMQKLGFVPEAQNDMIFSIICEELGLFGAIGVLLLFLLLFWRFMVIANNATDLYGALLVTGILSHLALQVILNVAVVTNFVPNTGISLPFISYGGTSVMFLLAEMGLALSVSRGIHFES